MKDEAIKLEVNIGEYKVTADERQFIVNKKSVIKEGRFTKSGNVGKEIYKPMAYATNFESALKFIPQDVLKTNKSITAALKKLRQIQADIKALPKPIKITVEKVIHKE